MGKNWYWPMLLILISGCSKDAPTIWSAEQKAPDGYWTASARTRENAGFGSGSVETSVYVTQDKIAAPIQVLGFDNDNGRPIGVTSVNMQWLTPSHLDVTYKADATLGFQVVKYAGLEITAHQSGAK
jgi:hypothetical protein